MSEIFLKIVNMSIAAGWLVLAVLLLRLLLKKAPKWISVLLWGFVAVRLVCPFTLESALSLIPSAETVSPDIMMDWTPELSTGIGSMDALVNPIITEAFAPDPISSANPLQILIPIWANLYLLGIVGMLIYTAVSYLLLRRKVSTAIVWKDNIYQSEYVTSPFVLGILKPRIYLPFGMDEKNTAHVLAHELSHIRRRDHWWKPLGFLLLTVHWFNPLIWLGYILLCRDIELACDEKVIKELDSDAKADYSQALVACSVSHRRIAACPLAFGEVGVKARVKSVLHYKKPAFWLIVAAIVICLAVAACFLTDPATGVTDKLSVFIDCQIAGHYQTDKTEGNASCVNWEVLGTKKRGNVTSVYMWVLYEEYSLENGLLHQQTGCHIPTLITVKWEDNTYKLIEYWEPRDGSFLEAGIREKFPWHLQAKALDSQRYIGKQKAENEQLAWEYFQALTPPPHESDLIAKSGGNTVSLVGFSVGTPLPTLVDSVQWLTIAPGEDELVPFRVLHNDQERYGGYGVFDAETFQSLDYFLPSGLSPQTYLFQNADPDRAYIVTLKTDEGSYAFGVRFDQTIAPSPELRNPYIQEYRPGADGIQGEVDTDKYLAVSPDFAIGADRYGYAVFKNPSHAFQTFLTLYADGLAAIRAQYDLQPITRHDYSLYKTYGWQTTQGTAKALEQAHFVTSFLDIYENSFTDDHDKSLVFIEDTITTDLVTYYKLSDGTWRADGQNYRYRLEVTGRPRETVTEDSRFVFLSNLETITFDDAWKASGLASSFLGYFQPHEALLVEMDIHLENDVAITDTITTALTTYYKLSDGTWRAGGRNYRYRLEIIGRMHAAAMDSTFVYLSNLEEISFDRAWRAAGLSSNSEDYFKPEEAVLVDWQNSGVSTAPLAPGQLSKAKPDKIILVDPDTFRVVQILDTDQLAVMSDLIAQPLPEGGYGFIFHGQEVVLRAAVHDPEVPDGWLCYSYQDGYPTRSVISNELAQALLTQSDPQQ